MKTNRTSHYLIVLAIAGLAIVAACSGQQVQSAIPQTSNRGQTCEVAKMSGGDIGAKVNACDKSLGSNRGEIVLAGGGVIQTQIVISPQHTLRVVSGTYSAANNGAVIKLKDNSSLVCNSWDAVLQESTGGLDEAAGSPFTIVTAYNGASLDAPNGSLARNLAVTGCHFRGARKDFNSAPPTVSLLNCHDCKATNNWLEATRTIGIQSGGAPALGNYALNVTIAKNQFTNVASQNIAVVNSVNAQVIDNVIKAPGITGGPGVVPIDIEPNTGDRIQNVKVANNLIDMTNTVIDGSGAKGLHGIAINNLNGARPFTGVEVTNNTIYGANLNDPNNHISGGLILARGASNTLIANNTLRRGTYGILIDSGSSGIRVVGNQLSTTGSGSSEPIRIADSSGNHILENKLWADPGNFMDFSGVSRNIIEAGNSNNNVFERNDAVVHITGSRSRKIS